MKNLTVQLSAFRGQLSARKGEQKTVLNTKSDFLISLVYSASR
jgi:hypothetical protein